MKAIIGLCAAAAALGIANLVVEARKRSTWADSEEYFDGLARDIDSRFKWNPEGSEDYAESSMSEASDEPNPGNSANVCEDCHGCGSHCQHTQPSGLKKEPYDPDMEIQDPKETDADITARDLWDSTPAGQPRPFTEYSYDLYVLEAARRLLSTADSYAKFQAYTQMSCRIQHPYIDEADEAKDLQPYAHCHTCRLYDLCRGKVAELTGVKLNDSDIDSVSEDVGKTKGLFGNNIEDDLAELKEVAGRAVVQGKEAAQKLGHKAADVGVALAKGSVKGLAASLKFAAKQAAIVSSVLDDMVHENPIKDDAEDCPDEVEPQEPDDCAETAEVVANVADEGASAVSDVRGSATSYYDGTAECPREDFDQK